MTFETDISGMTLYLYEMEPIVIVSQTAEERAKAVRLILSDSSSGDTILDESYFFGFDGKISIDIRDILRDRFSISLPAIDMEAFSDNTYAALLLDVGGGVLTAEFTVNGMSPDATGKVTDIDVLRVPENYILPLAIHDFRKRSGVEFIISGQRYARPSWLACTGSGKGSIVRFVGIAQLLPPEASWLRVEFSGTDPVISTPHYLVVRHHFEQYLFANRYGGFDNVPMNGVLEQVPEYEFENAVYGDSVRQVRAEQEQVYVQHSGYLSRQSMEAMMELIGSRQIYRLCGRMFRRIVVLETDISSRSDDALHSFSFRYKFAEPVDIKSYSFTWSVSEKNVSVWDATRALIGIETDAPENVISVICSDTDLIEDVRLLKNEAGQVVTADIDFINPHKGGRAETELDFIITGIAVSGKVETSDECRLIVPSAGNVLVTDDYAYSIPQEGGSLTIRIDTNAKWLKFAFDKSAFPADACNMVVYLIDPETGVREQLEDDLTNLGQVTIEPDGDPGLTCMYVMELYINWSAEDIAVDSTIEITGGFDGDVRKEKTVEISKSVPEKSLADFQKTSVQAADGTTADFIAMTSGVDSITVMGSMFGTCSVYGSDSAADDYLDAGDPSWEKATQVDSDTWTVPDDVRHIKISVNYMAGMPSPLTGTFNFFVSGRPAESHILTVERSAVSSVYQLRVTSAGPNKTQVIATISDMAGLGLAEAKSAVDNAEWFGSFLDYEATDLQATLQDLGAELEARKIS